MNDVVPARRTRTSVVSTDAVRKQRGGSDATQGERPAAEHRENGDAPHDALFTGGALEREHELVRSRGEEVCDDHPRKPSERAEHISYIASLL